MNIFQKTENLTKINIKIPTPTPHYIKNNTNRNTII